jgi:hypothetical protein
MSLLKKLKQHKKYRSDKKAFLKAGGFVSLDHPIYDDFDKQAGTASGHYFHQDLLVASFIHESNPIRHIDIGSSIEGFVSHVASFRKIEIIDIRPLTIAAHPQIVFTQGNLMSPDASLLEACDSLSCLHALEHFGLGRYNDPIDPQGHIKGFANLHKMLKPGGTLYISFPVGEKAVHFNAHRVFDPEEILEWSINKFNLERFDFVDDNGDLHKKIPIHKVPPTRYGCGIYTLKKTN